MRIVYDHQAFSLQRYGGITHVFSEIIRYLNCQPNISITMLLGYSSTQVNFRELVSAPGRVFHPGQTPFSPGMPNYLVNEALTALYAPFLGKFDIYHNTLYRFSPAIRATRKVTTHHDCVQERFPQLFPDHRLIIRAKRHMFRQADLIICVSEASRNDLLYFYDISPEKAVVIHNGVSPMQRVPLGEAAVREHVHGDFLLYVGARHAYKNFDGLLQAYAESGAADSYSLLVVGGGPPSRSETELVGKLRLSGQVKFVRHASPVLLAEAYALSRLFIYPSIYEGFGMPPIEAASVGCVSLVASNPATREICGNAAFYFDPASQSDFSRMLSVALLDQEERALRLERARSLLQTYTWEECGKKTFEAYLRLQ